MLRQKIVCDACERDLETGAGFALIGNIYVIDASPQYIRDAEGCGGGVVGGTIRWQGIKPTARHYCKKCLITVLNEII